MLQRPSQCCFSVFVHTEQKITRPEQERMQEQCVSVVNLKIASMKKTSVYIFTVYPSYSLTTKIVIGNALHSSAVL